MTYSPHDGHETETNPGRAVEAANDAPAELQRGQRPPGGIRCGCWAVCASAGASPRRASPARALGRFMGISLGGVISPCEV